MSFPHWPCQPESLADIMDDNLIRFILAGAAEKYRMPLAIVDGHTRYDPFYPRQQATWFCRRLRGGDHEEIREGIRGAESVCREWDKEVADEAYDDQTVHVGEPVLRPCWLKLSDYVVMAEVAKHRFVLFTGQFVPQANKDLAIDEIKLAIREDMNFPKINVQPSETEKQELMQLIPKLPVADDKVLKNIRECSQNIQTQFQNQWQLLRDAQEDNIYQELVVKAQLLATEADQGYPVDWIKVDELLATLCDRLGCKVALFFAPADNYGRDNLTKHNILVLRASHGVAQHIIDPPPHFNWKKSGISEQEQRCVMGFPAVQISQRGIRGGASQNQIGIDLWHFLADDLTNSRSVIGLGGFNNIPMVSDRVEFLDQLLSTISRRIHSLQLVSEMHHAKDLNMELAEFLAHQVRSRLQTLYGFQSMALKYSRGNKSIEDLSRSSALLSRVIEDLATMAGVVHATDPVLYDPDYMMFEDIDPWSAIESAIEDQSNYAEMKGIEIRREITHLPSIHVDPFWFRILLGHILNNAIKYSRKAHDGHMRWIHISADHSTERVNIFIENFGLGILEIDKERIYKPGITASEKGFFKDRSGHRRGLYEANRIVYAHHGIIDVVSRHRSGRPVQSDNLEECITTFIVRVPLALQEII